jgi:hypothetical protein
MISTVKQTIEYFLKNKKEPSLTDITIKDKTLLERK